MTVGVVSGIVATLLCALAAFAWRHRQHLSVIAIILVPGGTVRVSVAALLRIKLDDSYVLVETPHRPGTYGPLGGVYKAYAGARSSLDRLSFREERIRSRKAAMERDLRGFLPVRQVPAFLRWVEKGEGRESSVECLRRELIEELTEVGHPELAVLTETSQFEWVRTVLERPRRIPTRREWQVRRLDVYDLCIFDVASATFRDRLFELASDPTESKILGASGKDILEGRSDKCILGPHSAYLTGSKRFREDLPAVSS